MDPTALRKSTERVLNVQRVFRCMADIQRDLPAALALEKMLQTLTDEQCREIARIVPLTGAQRSEIARIVALTDSQREEIARIAAQVASQPIARYLDEAVDAAAPKKIEPT